MKAVLISIQPKWCELIASGKKTVEVRKTRPKIDVPFKCYIYETKALYKPSGCNHFFNGEGKVIGEFVCECVTSLKADNIVQSYFNNTQASCLSDEELMKYANNGKLYYWHISDLVIYDDPKELSEFKKINRECWYADLGLAKRDCPECKNAGCFVQRPPQSWCYVEGKEDEGKCQK